MPPETNTETDEICEFIVVKKRFESVVTVLPHGRNASAIWARVVDLATKEATRKREQYELTRYALPLCEDPDVSETRLLAAVDAGEAEVVRTFKIEPPSGLDLRVTRRGPNLIDGGVLARAQELIDADAKEFPIWVKGDLRGMTLNVQEIEALHAGDQNKFDAARKSLYRAAYRVSGQAGTYGFPMATTVARQLFEFLGEDRELSKKDIRIAAVHVDSLNAIFANDLREEDSAAARALATLLRDAVGTAPKEGLS